jgi:misacylated tRNA(Ala) deacylase
MTDLLYYQDAYLTECDARVVHAGDDGIALDRTVFYATGGGQPGDSGVLCLDNGAKIVIENTRRRSADGDVLHIPSIGDSSVSLKAGDRVHATLDWEKRYSHMRVHTCLHLLSAVIPAGVTGGAIRQDSGRLDFDLPTVALDRDEVEAKLNALISADHAVNPYWIEGAELEARPELVKTMSVAPPAGIDRVRLLDIEGVDLQACGGTHVARTREIGPVKVTKIESKGARNRRVAIALSKSNLPGQNDYAI